MERPKVERAEEGIKEKRKMTMKNRDTNAALVIFFIHLVVIESF